MKIYTKGGDKGNTSLVGGKRVSKAHPRVNAYGTVDELISHIGLLRSYDINEHYKSILYTIQDRLMVAAALLANDGDDSKLPKIQPSDIVLLENEIDEMEADLPTLKYFILPGGHPFAASCHVARSVCRRAERVVIDLLDDYSVPESVIGYLNRLSDYLFVLARKLAKDMNVNEVYWLTK